jgi:deoxyribonuclease IV
MRIGAQVRQAGGLLAALRRGEAMGAEVVQVFAQSSRQWRLPDRADEVYATYREACEASPVVGATVCHAPYLINLISPDPETRARSFDSLVANLEAATSLGALGLVLHPGSHRGVDAATAVERIARCVVAALDQVQAAKGGVCDLLLENTAGAGDTVGRHFSELGGLLDVAGRDPRVGVCLTPSTCGPRASRSPRRRGPTRSSVDWRPR